MSNRDDPGGAVTVTNRHLLRHGRPWVPVSGELHYSRVPRRHWDERLRLMRAGGITTVACYLIWNHHEPERGRYRFDGERDVRGFVELAARIGLSVVLRIGPWAHGEVRHGGFPDWVQAAPVQHRTNDPGYLALVETWFRRLGSELHDLCGSHGPVIAVQLENELYDQPDHLTELKQIARRAGIHAPIWTATAWGGAQLPEGEVFPLFGGYADGFWTEHDAPWDPSFREHFFFSHRWDDPGIGADVRGDTAVVVPRSPSEQFPPATCELGGGMARAYHRRPDVGGRDVAAVALTKIGNGSAWQGYYMFAGGTNPGPDLQESHATHYPNDLPIFDYDFNAPISATGRVRESFALLRRQHAFLEAFGDALATMPSSLPAVLPRDHHDRDTLRWALRSDGDSGFVVINRHQPYEPLAAIAPVTVTIELGDRSVTIPDRPVALPPGLLAIWPFDLSLDGVRIRWATASPLTLLHHDGPTVLALAADRGVAATIGLGEDVAVESLPPGVTVEGGVLVVADGTTAAGIVLRGADGAAVELVVLSADDGDRAWVLEHDGRRRLLLADGPVWLDDTGALCGRSDGGVPRPVEYRDGALHPVAVVESVTADSGVVPSTLLRAAGTVPAGYGSRQGRASAPTADDRDRLAERHLLRLPPGIGPDAELVVTWTGDVLGLRVDDVRVADQFWAGQELVVDLGEIAAEAELVLELLPLHPEAAVRLPSPAQTLREATPGLFGRIEEVRWVRRGRWREAAGVDGAPA